MSLIICPSARLARSIKSDIAKQHIHAGQTHWQSPNVLTLTQWLDNTIETGVLSGAITNPQTLLSPLNEQLLWQQVIQQSLQKNAFGALFDIAGLANAAMEANKYVHAWRLTIAREQMNEEARQFVQWQRAFAQRCKQLNVLESVRYFDWQLDCIKEHTPKEHSLGANTHAASGLVNITRIEFAGFDQTAPQEQRLRAILVGNNIEVAEYVTSKQPAAQVRHIELQNSDAESRAAVAWAKQQLIDNPHAKLAIVSPQLSNVRNQLADLLDDVFYPLSVRPSQFEVARNYNFSLGTPLNQQAIIQAALNLLRLFSGYQLQQTDVSAALLSPFWSHNLQESDARAALDAKIREYLPMQFTLQQLIDFMGYQRTKGLNIAGLMAHIKAAQALLSNKKQSATNWASIFMAILNALNWPGQRTLSSTEYQAFNAWQKALDNFKKMDLLGGNFYQAEALQQLQHICTNTVFQAETTGEASIQILGIMEALSAPVDAMWCMHFNDHIWPPPARPNPLLPAIMQRAAKLPNADNSVQAAFASTVQARLLQSAKHIIFSSSLTDANTQLRASPLLKGLPILAEVSLAQTLAESLSQLAKEPLDLINDHNAPPVKAGEHVGGGTGLFRAQAICPAWAFYQFRLGAKALKTPSNGLDSMTRGILVHAVLANFWQPNNNLRHFADLGSMTNDDLTQALNTAIKAALEEVSKQQKTLSANLLALEHERLFKLIGDWLDYEKILDEAFTIIACEADKKVLIGGIEVTLKIDRIHALNNGGIEYIDYKTGQKPDIKSWVEPRIIEPQLPIYATFYDANLPVTGVQFGMVKTAEHTYFGLAQANFEDKKQKHKLADQFANWQAVLQHWQSSLEAIAKEIMAGHAAIQLDDEKHLAYCEVTPLLRLPERQLQFERFKALKVNQ